MYWGEGVITEIASFSLDKMGNLTFLSNFSRPCIFDFNPKGSAILLLTHFPVCGCVNKECSSHYLLPCL